MIWSLIPCLESPGGRRFGEANSQLHSVARGAGGKKGVDRLERNFSEFAGTLLMVPARLWVHIWWILETPGFFFGTCFFGEKDLKDWRWSSGCIP